jgi:hypothetical protein
MKQRLALIVAGLLLLAFQPISGQSGDSIMFEAEALTLSSPKADQCVQVGLYLTYRGTEKRSWSVLNSALNYTAPPGTLAGAPVARISDFSRESPGLTVPGTNHVNHLEGQAPCQTSDIVNSVTLAQGLEIDFVGGEGDCDCSESVNANTGRIELVAGGSGELFSTDPGHQALFAVVTFPLAAGAKGVIDLQFVPDTLVKDGNVLLSKTGEVLTAYTFDGSVTLSGLWPTLTLSHWGLFVFFGGFILSFLVNRRGKGGATEE